MKKGGGPCSGQVSFVGGRERLGRKGLHVVIFFLSRAFSAKSWGCTVLNY